MPIYEYFCKACRVRFEEIASFQDTERGKCPKCQDKAEARFSRFAISGQGDLRESTLHGCHDCHGHDHGGAGSLSGDPSHSDSSD